MENNLNKLTNNIKASNQDGVLEINESFLEELKHLKKVTDIKRDLYAIDLLENLLNDQELEQVK